MKPEIILLAVEKKNPAKEKEYNSTKEDSLSQSETSNEEDIVYNGHNPCNVIESSWRSVYPPSLETDVEGKWYTMIWLGK